MRLLHIRNKSIRHNLLFLKSNKHSVIYINSYIIKKGKTINIILCVQVENNKLKTIITSKAAVSSIELLENPKLKELGE